MTPDSVALDAAIRQARYLLFAFDGPVRRADEGSTPDSATPTAPYIHEAFAACCESGRSVVIIGSNTEADEPAYLDAHGLFTQITVIAASVADAITFLEVAPVDCLFITSSPADVEAARVAGTPVIGYAQTPEEGADLVDAGAVAFVYSMIDVALSLRAHYAVEESIANENGQP